MSNEFTINLLFAQIIPRIVKFQVNKSPTLIMKTLSPHVTAMFIKGKPWFQIVFTFLPKLIKYTAAMPMTPPAMVCDFISSPRNNHEDNAADMGTRNI